MNPIGTAISYNGNSLQTGSIVVADIDIESPAAKDAKIYPLAHANGSRIPFISYPSKIIPISGTISADSIQDLDTALDTFRSYFTVQDANLDVGYAGSTRRFIATATKIQIKRPGGLTYAKFSIEFTCTQPFGQDTNPTTILNVSGRTAASYTDIYTFAGTAPFQRPIVVITFTALSASGSASVYYGNNNNGQTITVTRTWATNDSLVIDSTLKTVTVNGSVCDFSGAFPEFAPGSGSIGYSDTLTTRTFNYDITYAVMYA